MKTRTWVLVAVLLAMLAGCAVVPVEPYGYGPPVAAYGPPPPVVVVRPAPRYYGYGYYGRPYRYWR